ncbi:hypothetical protein P3X46_028157 [Hevea brasiliensis]|uniref:TPX2 C-terminal domain-containing protein n=1 Tax=Hevea brasiliensis TaxID=3981 RepID=A0ABQ9KP03_HEVBR|nr:uncharacterized protein LOC110659556 [Hevea brasiliensis]XP_057993403.1 uncharacterized protein LOC110659556 [Hevea brasiliensis]XP_057993404.1 uncharacterized protein LOC110659556 [Hevea brasiliensis]XP_057993405.1 uncharacterized protein LOC110659556 [Hevea brasiliensis]XP_057993406.1 uncharacterized protein LOC110659556 [Hevea brasiliensis]XP_057993407.1 uncharacterized protein LOC110659556 [Hevea brasiliensis]XP_057993408.1 uncharacterized protein LOC110659556 [Hevea brasiliensis]XP_0
MAIETDHSYHRQASSSIWSRPELTSDGEGPQASPSQILDHGSISFGRYATETLAWEKFSVFTQNRCHEELEKFREPGLVAKKKAYFEEYYSKIRAMRALKAEQQEKTQTGSFHEGLCNATKEENNMEADALSEENMPNNANKIQVQDNDTTANFNPSEGGTAYRTEQVTKESESFSDGNKDKASTGDGRDFYLHSNQKIRNFPQRLAYLQQS